MTDRLRVVDYNDFDDATLTLSAPSATDFGAELTQNMFREDEYHSTDLSTVTMSFVLPETRVGSHFSIHHHGLLGANIALQLFSDAALTASVYNPGAIAVADFSSPAITITGTADSRGNNDPHAADASFFLWFSEVSYRGGKITLSGTPDDWDYYWLSRIWVGRYRQMTRTAKFGANFSWGSLSRGNRTLGGSKRSYRGGKYRRMDFDLDLLSNEQRYAWDDIMATVDTSHDVVLSLYPGVGTRDERDTTYAGTFSNINGVGRQVSRGTTKVQFEEN